MLSHEQGHFDITEIFALRFQKEINEANIPDTHEYFSFLDLRLKSILQECKAEQDKFDGWSRNTLGREYYYKWIGEQLDSLKDQLEM